MKLNPTLLIAASAMGVVVAAVAIVSSMGKSPQTNCMTMLRAHASEAEEKIVLPNSDGGLYLLVKTDNPRKIVFHGFAGPKTVENLRVEMINQGLLKVKVDTDSTCETDGGVVYTVVSGSYEVPEQPADPI